VRKVAKAAVVEDDGPSKAWLDSYADAMTLLLAFFVLLYAFSLLDEKKFAEFRYGVEQAFSISSPALPEGSGFLDEGLGINENAGQLAIVPSDVQNEIDELLEAVSSDEVITPDEVEELREAVEQSLAAAAVDINAFDVDLDPRGVVITLDERLLFGSGSARIGDGGAPALGAVARVLATLDNNVLVEGHTDSVPTTGTAWPTNWELSSARATAVLRALNESYGVPGSRLAAVGHADTRPRASNADPGGRQENRRTELVVLVEPDTATVSPIAFVDGTPAADASAGLDEVAEVNIAGFDDPVFSGS
jgi:chemotaxis protein MotB